MEKEATRRRPGVDSVSEAGEVGTGALEFGGKLDKLPNRSAEPVQLPDHQRIARSHMRTRVRKSRTVATNARHMVSEYPLAASASERINLKVEALISGRHSRISDQHAVVVPKLVQCAKSRT